MTINKQTVKSLVHTLSLLVEDLDDDQPSPSGSGVIKKSLDDEKRLATFVVLAPEITDLHGDIYSHEEVEKAAEDFRINCMKTNLAHLMMVDDKVSVITESYIAPADMTIGDTDIVKGTWLQTWRINDDTIWKGVKEGYWNGLSIQCKALTEDLEDDN